MARNKFRKKQVRGRVFPAPLAGVLLMAATMSLSYLWLRGRCESLGTQIKELEGQRTELRKRVANEEFKWANMTSPQNMERLLQAHNLVMKYPDERNIVRVRRTATEEAARNLFAQHGGGVAHD
jgi:hypothetical protein